MVLWFSNGPCIMKGCSTPELTNLWHAEGVSLHSEYIYGDRGGTAVKVLCYKSEGQWFDFSLT